MLRALLLLLVLANVGVFAWSRGWLEPMWVAPDHADREPARHSRQVRPEAVRVLPAASEAGSRAQAPRCVEIGPFGLVDAAAAELVLEGGGLQPGSWERDLRGPAQVWLRVPRADAALREKLQALATASTLMAGGFRACAP